MINVAIARSEIKSLKMDQNKKIMNAKTKSTQKSLVGNTTKSFVLAIYIRKEYSLF